MRTHGLQKQRVHCGKQRGYHEEKGKRYHNIGEKIAGQQIMGMKWMTKRERGAALCKKAEKG